MLLIEIKLLEEIIQHARYKERLQIQITESTPIGKVEFKPGTEKDTIEINIKDFYELRFCGDKFMYRPSFGDGKGTKYGEFMGLPVIDTTNRV